MSDLTERLRLMPKSFPGLQVCDEAADRIEALEAARDAVEKKLWGLSTQWALHGGPFDHEWVSEVMAALAPEQDK